MRTIPRVGGIRMCRAIRSVASTVRQQLAALVCRAVLFGIAAAILATLPASAAAPRPSAWRASGRVAIGPGPTFRTAKQSVLGGPGWSPQLVDPAVALGRNARIAVAWPGPSGVLAATGSVRTSAFDTPSQLAPSLPADEEPTTVTAAISAQGPAIVGWRTGEPYRSGAAFLTSSAATWRSLTSLEGPSWEPGRAFAPSVAFDGRGDGFAVWVAPAVQRGSNGQPEEQVDASMMPATTEAWQAPIAISPVRPAIDDPRIAVSAGGGALAAWSAAKSVPGTLTVEASLRPRAARWGSPVALGSSEESTLFERIPMIAIRPNGEGLVAWRPPEIRPGRPHLLTSTGSLTDGHWQRPQAIPAPEAAAAGMASGRNGETVLWWITEGAHVTSLKAVIGAPRRRWSRARTIASWRPQPLEPEGSAPQPPTCMNGPQPFVAVDRGGDAIAVWREACVMFTAMHSTAKAAWTQAEPLAGVPVEASSSFALGEAGELVAVSLAPSAVTTVGSYGGKQVTTTVSAAVFRSHTVR
jgi:hypothetical protein